MKSTIKKIISVLLTVTILSLTIMPAMAEGGQGDFIVNPNYPISYEDASDVIDQIMALEEFITVDNGRFVFDMQRARERRIDQQLLDGQQAWLDSINQLAEAGEVVINSDLSIISDEGESACGHWYSCGGGFSSGARTHWWGLSRDYCDCGAQQLVGQLHTFRTIVGGGAALSAVSFLTAVFPGAASLAIHLTICASYIDLLATRIDANNHGRGVCVNLTWIAIFKIDAH
ncbi:MAG: hypothetical protein IKZ82_01205 [Clostridia bacterium]|nr:hypothetical protein [Clostridia bacterium]